MTRTRREKERIAKALSKRLERAETVYLTDFTGLDVDEMTDLRSRLKRKGIGYQVVKNTLAKRALEEIEFPDIEEFLEGPTGIVFGEEDPVVPAKIVREFAEEHEDRPSVKAGVVERRVVPAGEVERLAELPPRDELFASIAGSLGAPASGIHAVLSGLLRDLAWAVGEVARTKEEAGDGVGETHEEADGGEGETGDEAGPE